MEGHWSQEPTFPTWGHLFFNTSAGENACRLWVIWKSISQGKLACRTVATESDGLNLLLNGWESGKLWTIKQVTGDTIVTPSICAYCSWTIPDAASSSLIFSSAKRNKKKSVYIFIYQRLACFLVHYVLIFLFLLLRTGDPGMPNLARSMSNCANGIGQRFKDFNKGSGMKECVQLCTGKGHPDIA